MTHRPFVYTYPQSGEDVQREREEAKQWLDSVSPSMCLAKWLHTSIHLTNGRTHSCYHPPTHTISVDQIKKNPSALHNTDQKKRERAEMIAGSRPDGCNYCWSIEDAPSAPPGGHRSDRHYRSSEHWAKNYKDNVIVTGAAGDINPTYVEVNFNQACNFKCAYCSPHLSTAWQQEIEKFGPYPTSTPHNSIDALADANWMPMQVANKDNPYVEAFWEWWPELYNTLLTFRMTGGEPLMDKNTFKVLDYVADNPKGDLEISVTSNMCPPDPKLMDKFISSLKRIQDYETTATLVALQQPDPNHETWPRYVVDKDSHSSDTLYRLHLMDTPGIASSELDWYDSTTGQKTKETGSFTYTLTDTKACRNVGVYISVDGYGKQAEYIRNGLHYDTLVENTKRVLYETHFTTVRFINTFNLLSVPSFKKWLGQVLELRQWVNSLKEIPEKNTKYNNYWDRQRVWFDIPTLRNPEWMSIKLLPKSQHYMLHSALEFMEQNSVDVHGELVGFQHFEIDKLKRNIGWLESQTDDSYNKELVMRDFYAFFKEHDRRRGTNFALTFPEYKNFWKQCEHIHYVKRIQ